MKSNLEEGSQHEDESDVDKVVVLFPSPRDQRDVGVVLVSSLVYGV